MGWEGSLEGLTAGFDAATAPGRTERGSPILCSVCTRHSVDHTPGCTGSHGSRGTGNTPSYKGGIGSSVTQRNRVMWSA